MSKKERTIYFCGKIKDEKFEELEEGSKKYKLMQRYIKGESFKIPPHRYKGINPRRVFDEDERDEYTIYLVFGKRDEKTMKLHMSYYDETKDFPLAEFCLIDKELTTFLRILKTRVKDFLFLEKL